MDAATLLHTARTDAGLTLRELAARAETSHSTLSAYEHGAKTPSVDTFDRIVRAAGFSLDTHLAKRIRIDERSGLRRGEELVAVLELAGEFPTRHHGELRFPVFGRS